MRKNWVIPDVHGCSKTLRALIEDQIKPTRNDGLYFLGDYIDRGPDSKGVIDFIIELQEDEYEVRTLRGNHEDYLIRLIEDGGRNHKWYKFSPYRKLKKEWFRYGGQETLKSFSAHEVHDIPDKYVQWLKSLDFYLKLDSTLLVHAGLNFDLDDPFTDTHAMMWVKDFKVIPEKINNRKVIHGHVPVSLDFIDLLSKSESFDFIDLDNGVYMPDKSGFGNLVAMELHSRELVIQPNLDMV
jgi:serine/threonine protein phosphatase 1